MASSRDHDNRDHDNHVPVPGVSPQDQNREAFDRCYFPLLSMSSDLVQPHVPPSMVSLFACKNRSEVPLGLHNLTIYMNTLAATTLKKYLRLFFGRSPFPRKNRGYFRMSCDLFRCLGILQEFADVSYDLLGFLRQFLGKISPGWVRREIERGRGRGGGGEGRKNREMEQD